MAKGGWHKYVISVYISWLLLLLAIAFMVVNNISKYFNYILALASLITLIQVVHQKTVEFQYMKVKISYRIKYGIPVIMFWQLQ